MIKLPVFLKSKFDQGRLTGSVGRAWRLDIDVISSSPTLGMELNKSK